MSYTSRRVTAATLAAFATTGLIIAPAHSEQPGLADSASKIDDPQGSLQVPAIDGSQGSLGYPTATAHEGAPMPSPFPPDYLGGYISDVSSHPYGVYLDVISGFNDLRTNHPDVMKQNLDTAVRINNDAQGNDDLIARAQMDADAYNQDLLYSMSDALGPELQGALQDAIREHRLPKTEFLLGNGVLSRAGGVASSTFVEKEFFGYDRPFVQAPDRIVKYNKDGKNYYENSKAFPSGHTNQATWTSTLWAMMLPELAPQLLARGSEVGYDRIVMGVHSPLDVMGGRMTGIAAAADRWNDPKMRDAISQAAQELRAELEWRTGKPLEESAKQGGQYRTTAQAVSDYTDRMNYDFEQVGETNADMIVPQAAPDLLIPSHPDLNYQQRAELLRRTALPAGYPLDDQGAAGSWARLNLAAAMAADVSVEQDGSINIG